MIEEIFNSGSISKYYLLVLYIMTARYLLIAGIVYTIFYIWKKDKLNSRYIQTKRPSWRHIRHEIKWSLLTFLVFGLIGLLNLWLYRKGWTQLYFNVSEYGWAWFIASIPLMLVIHDTYFYWGHRFMHLKPVFKHVHSVHHHSTNPTPWAAFSFHPLEAFIEGFIGTVYFVIFPIHPASLGLFLLAMTLINVYGHLGYELLPHGFARGIGGHIFNTAFHHNMHHSKVHCNYGLYFNLWDRIMKTNHPNYEDEFDQLFDRQAIPETKTERLTA